MGLNLRGLRALVAAIVLLLIASSQPFAVASSPRSSVVSTVGSRIDGTLPPVGSRNNPLASGAGRSWLPLSDAMYRQAKASADAAAPGTYARGGN
ncbi:MAG TPA: hypothetical protein VIM30_07405, partial [Candidatus Limnocylindrales bacterium]